MVRGRIYVSFDRYGPYFKVLCHHSTWLWIGHLTRVVRPRSFAPQSSIQPSARPLGCPESAHRPQRDCQSSVPWSFCPRKRYRGGLGPKERPRRTWLDQRLHLLILICNIVPGHRQENNPTRARESAETVARLAIVKRELEASSTPLSTKPMNNFPALKTQ